MTVDVAFQLLARLSDYGEKEIRASRTTYGAARLRAVWKVHPDKGGSTSAYQRFNVACEMIEKYFDERET